MSLLTTGSPVRRVGAESAGVEADELAVGYLPLEPMVVIAGDAATAVALLSTEPNPLELGVEDVAVKDVLGVMEELEVAEEMAGDESVDTGDA